MFQENNDNNLNNDSFSQINSSKKFNLQNTSLNDEQRNYINQSSTLLGKEY